MPPIPGYPLSQVLQAIDASTTESAEKILAALQDADVILGRDAGGGDEFVVFGRDVLKEVSEGLEDAEGFNVLCIEIQRDPAAPDLQLLLELVTSIKGRHEFIDYGQI